MFFKWKLSQSALPSTHEESWFGCLWMHKISVFLAMFYVGNPFLISWLTKHKGVAWLWHWRGSMVWGWIFWKFGTSLSVTQPLAGRAVEGSSRALPRSHGLHPGLRGALAAQEGGVCCWTSSPGIFVRPEQSVPAVHPWNAEFGKAQGHWRIVTIMLAWNPGLSEQQCSDAVGSSCLDYSACPCVICVTTAHVWSWLHLQWGKNKSLQSFLWRFSWQHQPGCCFQWCPCVWSVPSVWMCVCEVTNQFQMHHFFHLQRLLQGRPLLHKESK